MKKVTGILIISILVSAILLGYWWNVQDRYLAEHFLETKGYNVISYDGQAHDEVVTEKAIKYVGKWQVQNFDTSTLIGKTVNYELFTVKNHPFDDWKNGDGKSIGKTRVCVFLVDHNPIGGLSVPSLPEEENLIGGWWSLEGLTIEEVKQKYSYKD